MKHQKFLFFFWFFLAVDGKAFIRGSLWLLKLSSRAPKSLTNSCVTKREGRGLGRATCETPGLAEQPQKCLWPSPQRLGFCIPQLSAKKALKHREKANRKVSVCLNVWTREGGSHPHSLHFGGVEPIFRLSRSQEGWDNIRRRQGCCCRGAAWVCLRFGLFLRQGMKPVAAPFQWGSAFYPW